MKRDEFTRTARLTVTLALLLLALSPGAQAALQAAQSTSTTITLTWTAPGDDGASGQAAQYDIRYSLSPITDANWNAAMQADNEPLPQAAGSSESFTVTGLDPGTDYYFAIKTADEVPNWSVLSNVVLRSTDQETTPPANIASLATGAVTNSSVLLTWTAPGDDGNTGTASQYDVRYSTSPITAANFGSATTVTGEPTPSAAGAADSFVVTGLNAETEYYFAVKTADEVPNWSGISNVVSATTGSETNAPSTIANLTAINPAESTITLAWTAPGDDGTVGTAAQYDIRYATTSINGSNFASATPATGVAAPQAAGTPETHTVGSLQPNTTYYFAIKAVDDAGNWSNLSNVVNSKTLQDQTAPAGINDLQAETGAGDGQINLGWTAPGDDGYLGQAAAYEVRYSQNNLTPLNWSQADIWMLPPTPSMSGMEDSLILTGLTPGQRYWIGVRAWDDGSNASPISNIVATDASFNLSLDADDDNGAELPSEYALKQNYPNPFNPETRIDYALPRSGHVTVSIYNALGQETVRLVDEAQSAGTYSVNWAGLDQSSNPVASGVYFYRIATEDYSASRKMVLLK